MTKVHQVLLLVFIVGELLIFPAQVQAQDCRFTSGPMNRSLTVGDINVILSCSVPASIPTSVIIWFHSLNSAPLQSTSFNFNTNPTFFTFVNGDVLISNVTVRHHGEYYCSLSSPCSSTTSPTGYVTVISPVLVEFTNLLNGQASASVEESLTIPFTLYGSPEPLLTLFKQASDPADGYNMVDDSRISISLSEVSFASLEFKDEGLYRIVSNNTEGEFMISFTVDVTGIIAPDITLNQSQFTPQVYGDQSMIIECAVPENAFDLDSGALTLRWQHASDNETVTSSDIANVYQMKLNETTIALRIRSVDESDNGNYLCFASNSITDRTGSFSIKGPPTSVSNLKALSFGPVGVILTWDTPNSYGADLTNYMIQYTKQNMVKTVSQMPPQPGSGPQHIVEDICPNGVWSVTVWAINEYNGIGSAANNIQVTINDTACDPTQTTTSTTSTQATPTRSTSATITSSIRDSTSSLTTGPEPTADGNSSGISSIPIVAGAAAGGFIVVISVPAFVFALACCCITVNRRGSSKSRAEQQWRQTRSNERLNGNGFVETNSLPTKSPDSQLNSYEVALPSPLPATPGYGPVYIDPHFEFPRENLEFTDILYDGAFTVIYKAKAVGIKENKPIDVAVKSLKEEFLDYDDFSSALVMEMEQLAQLEPHPNIVGLVRVCSVTRPVLMVMEYMCHGDLLGFLRTTRGHTDMYTVNPGTKNLPTHLKLTSRDLLSIIKQVSTGMQFLSEQKIVHGALCARNILVSTSMEVKIFNIGIHNLDNDETFESLVRWMAPEVFVDGIRTAYGDVWSFGILMWEIVTLGGTPYSDLVTDDLYTQLMSGVRLQKPPHCAQPVYDVMTMCWETVPQHRPLFFEMIDHLQNFNVSKMSYLDLRNYNETAYSQFDESERQQTSIL